MGLFLSIQDFIVAFEYVLQLAIAPFSICWIGYYKNHYDWWEYAYHYLKNACKVAYFQQSCRYKGEKKYRPFLQEFLQHFSEFILKEIYQFFSNNVTKIMLKQNIYSKVFDVNKKFPREGFHG